MELKPLLLDTPVVTSKFGPRIDPISKKQSFHNGVDFRAVVGTTCLAVADGKVVASKVNGGGASKGYGYYLVIQHSGFWVLYAHLNKLGISVGTTVKKGQEVALTGNSGASTGPHLHFEVRTGEFDSMSFSKNAKGEMPNAVDPETFKIEPLYMTILKESGVSMDRWTQFIAEQSNDKTGKFLPDLIVKVWNTAKKS